MAGWPIMADNPYCGDLQKYPMSCFLGHATMTSAGDSRFKLDPQDPDQAGRFKRLLEELQPCQTEAAGSKAQKTSR